MIELCGLNPVRLRGCRHAQARGHPQLEAEVVYTARHEYCESAEDFLTRRTRLAFLDIDAATEALPRVRARNPVDRATLDDLDACDAHVPGLLSACSAYLRQSGMCL